MSLEKLIQAALKRNSEREHAFTNSEQTVLDKRHILTDHESSVLAGRCSQLLLVCNLKVDNLKVNLIHRTTHIGIFSLQAS